MTAPLPPAARKPVHPRHLGGAPRLPKRGVAPRSKSVSTVVGTARPSDRMNSIILYSADKGVDAFVREIASAAPLALVDTERFGVHGRFLRDVADRMDLPTVRILEMVGVPKATAAKKVAANDVVSGSGGQAALGMAKLIAKAEEIVANSTAPEARDFDAAKWLGQWLDVPQPALGGRTPGSLLGTPTGVEIVLRLLGAFESGAYQ